MDIDYSSVNKIASALRRGKITNKDIIKRYIKTREKVIKQIKRIQKSEIPFTKGDRPKPPPISTFKTNLGDVDMRALIRELASMEKFTKSRGYTVRGRKATRKRTIKTLKERGINISEDDYMNWVEFIKWFRFSAWSALYDSDSERTQQVYEEGSNASEWNVLFEEYAREDFGNAKVDEVLERYRKGTGQNG